MDNPETTLYQQFRYLYTEVGSLNAAQLAEIYADDVTFVDPVHRIDGLKALQRYFADLSAQLNHCRFEFVDELVGEGCAHITWNMHFSHQRLQRGRRLTLRGMTLIRFDDRIHYHEDCYDLGAMLYENLPLLGPTTRWLKKRLEGKS